VLLLGADANIADDSAQLRHGGRKWRAHSSGWGPSPRDRLGCSLAYG
jgi:hypothetical protein